LTFLFVLVIFGSTSKLVPKGVSGVVIGLTYTMIHIVGIPITGASVNPARSLGPALFVGGTAMEQLPLFWLAPMIGGVLAAIAYKYARYSYQREAEYGDE